MRVELNRRCTSQEPGQACLALAEHHRSQILAVELQQVERLQDGRAHRAMAMQGVGDATPSSPQTTASPSRVTAPDLGRRTGDRWIPARPVVAAASEEPRRLAVPADDQPMPVVLDLVRD
jgi:hypothetical protein